MLGLFEKWALNRIFGPDRKKVKGNWRKANNEELRDFHAYQSITSVIKSGRMRWARHAARIKIHVLVDTPEETERVSPTSSWVYNTEIDLKTEWEVVKWIIMAQDMEHWRHPFTTVMSRKSA